MTGGIVQLTSSALDGRVGGKALGLRWLADHGYSIPPTWIILPSDSETLVAPDVPMEGKTYAVRSSANVEDGAAISYAGQFVSVLGVSGSDELSAAIHQVLDSAKSEGVLAYQEHQLDDRRIEMAVIIQEMVRPVTSGVAFSKNPITGLAEVVVEAVEGSGDRLQAEGVTPQRWVERWGDIIQSPDVPIVAEETLSSIISGVTDIADAYGSPVDAEWVFDGSDVWWVQVREITGLEDVTLYSRRIAKEVLPGMIKPLVWSINVPMVNTAWLELIEEAAGDLSITVDDLAKAFGYRAYFNMSAFGDVFTAFGMPRESLELLIGLPAGTETPRIKPTGRTMLKTPRLMGMALRRLRYGKHVDAEVLRLDAVYREYASRTPETMTDDDLLADIEDLRSIGVEAARINVVTPLLANLFAALLRRRLRNSDGDPMAGIAARTNPSYDPNPSLDILGQRISALSVEERAAIDADGYAALPVELRSAFDDFFDAFGHFSDSGSDFSVAPWRESRDTVVRVAASRPAQLPDGEQLDERPAAGSRPPGTKYLTKKFLAFAERRDAVSSTYTFGYGLFRPYLLECGARLAAAGSLDQPEDVMYLTIEEVRESLQTGTELRAVAMARRTDMESLEDADLPDLVYGEDYVPAPAHPSKMRQWSGTPTAKGHHRGTARVVTGIADFDRVTAGDVVIIPFSDVGWTPLFAKAGAVVAESGGMLSHSSIVAREYGLPCVVSVAGALRVPDGSTITVDGYHGTVTLEVDS